MRYAIAPNGIFWTIQGEGHLRGVQMAFLRLAGCSIGCPECDTDYSVDRKMEADELAAQVAAVVPENTDRRWVWVTGGEPADRDLRPLFAALRRHRFSIAVATSGHKRFEGRVDWLSVSPHDLSQLVLRSGDEIKLVDGLNELPLVAAMDDLGQVDFRHRYVQPLSYQWDGEWVEDPESMERCLAFLSVHPNWALSRQDHKHWRVP